MNLLERWNEAKQSKQSFHPIEAALCALVETTDVMEFEIVEYSISEGEELA